MSDQRIISVETHFCDELRKCLSDDRSCDLMLTKSVHALAKYQKDLYHFCGRIKANSKKKFAANMQNVINSVKGTALGVAEFLTPVLKVSQITELAS